MKLKSYFSGSVESAMEVARRELGEEALLVHARPTTPETRYLGAYEVVFGVMPSSAGLGVSPVSKEELPLRGELDSLWRQIDRLTQSFEAPPVAAVQPQPLDALLEEELDGELARKLGSGTRLDGLISVDPTLGAAVALAGPPGVGKTTTLIKLAVRFGLAKRRSTHIITADVQRVAAADQLRALAAILGIGCDVAETPGALAQLLEEQRGRDLILIDTPGFSLSDLHRDAHEATELAGTLTGSAIDTHLVLSAAMKSADMARIAEGFCIFKPSKLMFTRIDETARYGALVNEGVRSQLPISFLTNGQRIPDDLEAATIQRLAALVLGERPILASKGAAA